MVELKKELEGIKIKYEQIQDKIRKSGRVTVKDKPLKIELTITNEDLIKDEFWDSVKID